MNQVSVSARILRFPNMCCCCARPGPTDKFTATATRVTGKRVLRTHERSWSFPICSDCLSWRDAVLKARMWFIFCLILGGVSAYVGTNSLGLFIFSLIGSVVFGLLGYHAASIAEKRKVSSASSINPAIYHQWNGSVHSFTLANREYYEKFCIANQQKLVGF